MKRKKTFFITIIVAICVLLLFFLSFSTGGKEGKLKEAAAHNLLTRIYTVLDHDRYQEMLRKQQKYQEQSEIISDYIELYAPYTTEQGLEQLFANRIAFYTESFAYENDLLLEIQEIAFRPTNSEKDPAQYDYEVQLLVTDKVGEKLREVIVKGAIVVKKVPSENYLVDFIRITDDSELMELDVGRIDE
ncbi:MAG: hypothetical protein WDA11_14780 [Thiohalomonadaceae bacterium]